MTNAYFIEELEKNIQKLKQENNNKSLGIILDLLNQQICQKKLSIKDIAYVYLKDVIKETCLTNISDLSSTSSSSCTLVCLLKAFLMYKQNKSIEPKQAWILSLKSGLYLPYKIDKPNYILREIISGIDGIGFDEWLYLNSKLFKNVH